MKQKRLYFTFAGLTCEISAQEKHIGYLKKCYSKSPYASYVSSKKAKNGYMHARLMIFTTRQSHLVEQMKLKSYPKHSLYKLYCSEDLFFVFPLVEQVLRKIFYMLFFKHNGFVLHASAVVYRNKAFIFSGGSGSGKSTVAKKLHGENNKTQIIADNNVYIRQAGNKFFIFPPAFLEWNVSHGSVAAKDRYSIAKLFILKRSKSSIQKISLPSAYKKLFGEIQVPIHHLTDKQQENGKRLFFTFVSNLAKNRAILSLSFDLNKPVHPIIIG